MYPVQVSKILDTNTSSVSYVFKDDAFFLLHLSKSFPGFSSKVFNRACRLLPTKVTAYLRSEHLLFSETPRLWQRRYIFLSPSLPYARFFS